MPNDRPRCDWGSEDPLMIDYHDTVWGVPQHDDRTLFEFLLLEGAQAGLSWLTILKRKDTYAEAFQHYDIERIAAYGEADTARLLADEGIIRNRAKVASAIRNANATLNVQREFGSFDAYVWSFVDGTPRRNAFDAMTQVPPETDVSKAMSRDLKERDFNFVGPTICYAFMQAVGMVNDHLTSCFRYGEV
jgi:DNA-3-methyladenine glycosylase I